VNAAEHLQVAVQLLAGQQVADKAGPWEPSPNAIALAQAHAVCALAIELGVPPAAVSVPTNVTPIKPAASQPDNGGGQDNEQEAI